MDPSRLYQNWASPAGGCGSVARLAAPFALLLMLIPACARDEPAAADDTAGRELRVVFPETAYVDDPSVNAFVRETVQACLDGKYEPFRARWSEWAEPFTREQFENGWRHADRITVLEVQAMRRPDDGSLLYYVHATIDLSKSVRKPTREVVLLVVNEDGNWRLSKAPQSLVKRVIGKITEDRQS